MGPGGAGWGRMGPDGAGWGRMGPATVYPSTCDIYYHKVRLSNLPGATIQVSHPGARWGQVGPDGAGWGRPGGARWGPATVYPSACDIY